MDDSGRFVESAFVQGIQASPLDRLPRLVYADWLDERGDERGEYLRLQCQVVKALERLAQLSDSVPTEWANGVDLFSQGFHLICLSALGELRAGEPIERALVVECCVKPWQSVVPGQSIVDIETEKYAASVPTGEKGVVVMCFCQRGQYVHVGSPLVLLLRAEC